MGNGDWMAAPERRPGGHGVQMGMGVRTGMSLRTTEPFAQGRQAFDSLR